jgi:hypothetical protein
MTTIIVPFEIGRRGLPAQVAIDALIIYVKAPCRILRVIIYELSHTTTFLFPSPFDSPKSQTRLLSNANL